MPHIQLQEPKSGSLVSAYWATKEQRCHDLFLSIFYISLFALFLLILCMFLVIKVGDAFEFHFVRRVVIWIIVLIFIQNVAHIEINFISNKYYYNSQCSMVHLHVENLSHLHFKWNHEVSAKFRNILEQTAYVLIYWC